MMMSMDLLYIDNKIVEDLVLHCDLTIIRAPESESIVCLESYCFDVIVSTDLVQVRDLCKVQSFCAELELDSVISVILHGLCLASSLSASDSVMS